MLVVDDEDDIRLLVRLTLEREGHDVTEAADGREALSALAERHPDLVVLDVMMPDVDGWTVLERMKHADDPGVVETPVVLLTALGSPMDRIKGGIEGAVRYLTKPIDLDALTEAARDALAQPEPEQRRRAQQHALESLARTEATGVPAPSGSAAPRPRLLGLERDRRPRRPQEPPAPVRAASRVDELTDKQRALLEAVRDAPTVLAASEDLAMSRSNIYASLRRISRRLGVASVAELLDLIRSGRLLPRS